MYKDSSCRSSPQPQQQPQQLPETASAADFVCTHQQKSPTSIAGEDGRSSLPAAAAAEFPSSIDGGSSSESSSSSESDFETHSRRPSITISSSTSTSTSAKNTVAAGVVAPPTRRHHHVARCDINADVRLLRKIGYIASRVRFLAKLYGDFKLINPYSPAKQRRQLQEILLKHSIIDPAREVIVTAAAAALAAAAAERPIINTTSTTTASSLSLTPVSSIASSYCCLPTESSIDEETIITAAGNAVRRKSSASAAAASASIVLLEDLLVQFYEDRRNKVTVIRRRRSRRRSSGNVAAATAATTTTAAVGLNGNRKHLIIMSGSGKSAGSSSSNERLLQQQQQQHANDNDENAATQGDGLVGVAVSDLLAKTSNLYNANNATASSQKQQQQQQRTNAFLQPSGSSGISFGHTFATTTTSSDVDNQRRRRASDCSTHPGQQLSNQLQVTLKNNNCTTTTSTKFPFHRGSCGGAGEHLLAANSIANRSTIILSKSCSNVDGSGSIGIGVGGNGSGPSHPALYGSSDLRAVSVSGVGGGSAVGGNGVAGNVVTPSSGSGTNGNNEYSIVQLNNTIIQCHFNDDDFRALVKDLRRKVEYTERMNWLCLSKRPMGPPHRKSSLPKHQDVKKRFLEICDATFSDEVKAALRLPAFDSYEWSDVDVIHLMQTMFVELGFIEKFHIPPETLREWLYEVYKHYNEVPFHNFRHCFCVAQMMYAITRQANLLQRLGDLECLILLVSCICHDLDHPGYNNIYQINARTELALRYNDISPLENHHCSIAFRLLEHPDCNIFKNFGRETFNQIREGIIRCILATDMARHNEILTQFKEITPVFDYTNRSHINLLCMVLIKVADISNEARPMDVAEPWLDRLLQEFFAQSAAEKLEGLPVTPFMDPDKVSKPGSQVRFIGLVLLPLFEALGDLVPELIELIIIPVRVALDYYKRLNDAQNKSRKSMADTSSIAASENNSGGSDAAVAANTTTAGAGGGGGVNSGGSISPQMPRSQSGISVKSRRSIPSQKSASRTSVDEPQCIAAELHDLPEGSESGDSETATEVDVAEKTSKFKVDTEGSSNRSKSSHSTSRKSSREKRPSMIGEMCSSGGGQRTRNSYGNIHGYHGNRNHFGSNRAVSLDQYSTNNRRLSDGLQAVISDSNVFYSRGQNRGSQERTTGLDRLGEDLNMNATGSALQPSSLQLNPNIVPNIESATRQGVLPSSAAAAAVAAATTAATFTHQSNIITSSNGNLSPTQQVLHPKHHCCAASAAAAAAAATAASNNSNGIAANTAATTAALAKSSWKTRLKQFSDYFGFSFDKGTKRFGSTRSSPCSVRNNNATQQGDPLTGKQGVCCTISNNLQSPGFRLKHPPPSLVAATSHQDHLINAGRLRAYSLDVPCSHSNPRYSSSSGGGGDSSRKSSRHDGGGTGDDNNSNNTLHSSGGAGSEMPTCMPPPIRIGSVDASDTILITTGLPRVITPANLGGEAEPSLSIDLGMASGSSYDPPKI